MFPNPQSALPLPSRPNLEYYRKLAKELVKSEGAAAWATDEVAEFARDRLSKRRILAEAQFVIARSYGFESWPKFAKHLEALAKISPISRFEAAADAIVDGDIASVQRLLREDPQLIRARSTREHGAMLLHYVAANGVENYRQKTPTNIVQITNVLLDAGAEIDATANVYGGGCTTLDLAATSIHPVRAGVLEELLQTLLDHGANLALTSVKGCLSNWRPQAAAFLASRGARLDLAGAAGIGRLDVVKGLIDGASEEQLKAGFLFACGFGHNSVVQFLLDRGADPAMENGQTGSHWAVLGGHLDTVKLLLRYNPPLEAKNKFGGTVLGQTLWSAGHGGDPDVYIAILEALIAAGAQIPERHTPVNAQVDEWMAKHGSRAEPSWYWPDEKPRAT